MRGTYEAGPPISGGKIPVGITIRRRPAEAATAGGRISRTPGFPRPNRTRPRCSPPGGYPDPSLKIPQLDNHSPEAHQSPSHSGIWIDYCNPNSNQPQARVMSLSP